MQITAESISSQIPFYLTQNAKDGLVKALKDFPKSTKYFINLYPTDFLQGDGWTSLDLINFDSGEKKSIKGILLSNSCDIDPKNKREVPAKLSFSPIVKLDSYIAKLTAAGVEAEKISAKVTSIKDQKVSSVFYLPSSIDGEDYIALLDDVHTLPLDHFRAKNDKKKLFTLSQIGFYLFLFKLSVHFCRFHEEVERAESLKK